MSTGTMDPVPDPDLARLEGAADGLSEHFDTVLILATRYEGCGKTELWKIEVGNQFALLGSAQAWMEGVLAGAEEEGDDE